MQHFNLTIMIFTFLKHTISLIVLALYLCNCTVHSAVVGVIFVVFPFMKLAAVLRVNSFFSAETTSRRFFGSCGVQDTMNTAAQSSRC